MTEQQLSDGCVNREQRRTIQRYIEQMETKSFKDSVMGAHSEMMTEIIKTAMENKLAELQDEFEKI